MNKKIIITTYLALTPFSLLYGGAVADWVNEKVIKPTGKAFEDAGNTINEKVIKPTGAAIEQAAQTVNKEVIKPTVEGVTTAYNVVKQGVEGGISAVEGTVNTIKEISPLVNEIQASIAGVITVINGVESQIRAMAAAAEPFVIIDRSYDVANGLLDTSKAIDPTFKKVADIISIIGTKIVKPFDNGTGTNMQSIATSINNVRTDVAKLTGQLQQTVIPTFKQSTKKINDQINIIVRTIRETRF